VKEEGGCIAAELTAYLKVSWIVLISGQLDPFPMGINHLVPGLEMRASQQLARLFQSWGLC
jgi:hypothetical protein